MYKPLRKSERNREFMSPKKINEMEKELYTRLISNMKKSIKKKTKGDRENFEIKDGNKTYLIKYEGETYDGETIYHDWEEENPVKLKKGEKIYNVYNKNEVNKYGYVERSIQDDGTGLPAKYTKKKGLMFFPNDEGGIIKKTKKRRKKSKTRKRKKRKSKTRKRRKKSKTRKRK